MLPLASAGQREAEGWLTKVNQAHPNPAPSLAAVAHGTWTAYYNNLGSVDSALEHNRLARQAADAAAGQGPLFPMLAQLPLQEVGAHLLAGDIPAAAIALHQGRAPLSVPIVDEVRSPVIQAWVAFLQGDLVAAAAVLDRVAGLPRNTTRYRTGWTDLRQHGPGGDLPGAPRTRARRTLLGAARAAARINGRPYIQAMVDTWIARLATAEGVRAGALASLAQARLALAAPDDRVRAQFASRSSASRSPWRQPKQAG